MIEEHRECSVVLVPDLLVEALTVLTLSSHVGNEEDDSEHEAKTSNDDIADGKEEVLSSEDIGSRKHEVFTTFEGADIEIVLNVELILIWLKVC